MELENLLRNLESEVSREIAEFLDENLDTHNTNWWQLKVIKFLSPQQKFNSIKNDIFSLDMSGLISVFSQNYVDFLTSKSIIGYELRSLALSVRGIRNSVAHKSLSISFTSDTIIYFLITYKIFLKKIHEFNNVDNLKIIDDINYELSNQMTRFQETHSYEKDNYTSVKKNNKEKKLFKEVNSDNEKKVAIKVESNNNEENDNNVLISEDSKISTIEARDLLIGLREDIRRIYPDIPREHGILRKSMLDMFISKKINNTEKLNLIPEDIFSKTNNQQDEQLEKIFKIINKIEY